MECRLGGDSSQQENSGSHSYWLYMKVCTEQRQSNSAVACWFIACLRSSSIVLISEGGPEGSICSSCCKGNRPNSWSCPNIPPPTGRALASSSSTICGMLSPGSSCRGSSSLACSDGCGSSASCLRGARGAAGLALRPATRFWYRWRYDIFKAGQLKRRHHGFFLLLTRTYTLLNQWTLRKAYITCQPTYCSINPHFPFYSILRYAHTTDFQKRYRDPRSEVSLSDFRLVVGGSPTL